MFQVLEREFWIRCDAGVMEKRGRAYDEWAEGWGRAGGARPGLVKKQIAITEPGCFSFFLMQ